MDQPNQPKSAVLSRQVFSAAEENDLPDSSFAMVLPGGRKDETGRTVPRSLRKLPFRNGEGAIILELAFNAIAVLNGARGGVQAGRPQKIAAWNKLVQAIREERPDYVPPARRF